MCSHDLGAHIRQDPVAWLRSCSSGCCARSANASRPPRGAVDEFARLERALAALDRDKPERVVDAASSPGRGRRSSRPRKRAPRGANRGGGGRRRPGSHDRRCRRASRGWQTRGRSSASSCPAAAAGSAQSRPSADEHDDRGPHWLGGRAVHQPHGTRSGGRGPGSAPYAWRPSTPLRVCRRSARPRAHGRGIGTARAARSTRQILVSTPREQRREPSAGSESGTPDAATPRRSYHAKGTLPTRPRRTARTTRKARAKRAVARIAGWGHATDCSEPQPR